MHDMGFCLVFKVRRDPHMVKPPAAVGCFPILRAVAPPCVEFLAWVNEMPGDIHPVARLLNSREMIAFDARVANHIDQLLMAPHIMFKRGHIEVTRYNCGGTDAARPVFHPREKIQFLSELRISLTVRDIAACRNVDIVEANALGGFDIQLCTDMPRFAIGLPVFDPAVDAAAPC